MKQVSKVVSFIFVNRRVVGTIIGGVLMLFGYGEEAKFFTHIGAES